MPCGPQMIAMVGEKTNNRVIGVATRFHRFQDTADAVIDIADFAVVTSFENTRMGNR